MAKFCENKECKAVCDWCENYLDFSIATGGKWHGRGICLEKNIEVSGEDGSLCEEFVCICA